MKRTSCFVETAITSLVAILFLTNLACVKRIPIPADTPEIKSYMDIVYVHLKPGKQYLGKSFLAVKNPKLEDEYLMGKRRNKEIKIPLDDIDVIEVNRFDAKKTVIVSLGVITFAAVGSWIARGIGRANVD
ncbi:MAG: hypothetical protein GWN55_01490 [Phycisphaerae bacterium]|nr:hypothetical protein [candidate division KSB1 bacterium]NIV00005.1 hypothetical protein [Phycisphaerae bacterium]NIS23024.1 hypothetical protein [candidate division KSB1 bacterium]NIT69882.1 hypothetical protein [candidate division KSB1 bacterium]NIU23531.1 hypothetical protein [candidate division KSB1 bacterium]